jgi:ribosomal protein S18 acetylase RimI-like enzyme
MPPPLKAAAGFGISFRRCTDADLPFLLEVYASTRREEVAQTGWPQDVQEAFLASQFDAQHRYYRMAYTDAEWLVVERHGEPIGRLYLDDRERELRIVDIALLPHSRGQGLGAALLADIIASSPKTVSIHVEMNNPAMGLYLRLGFAEIEQQGVYFLMERPADPS